MQATINTEIPNFINHCKFEKMLSTKTIKAYTIDLNQFAAYLKKNEHSIWIDKITKKEIRNYCLSPLKDWTNLKNQFSHSKFRENDKTTTSIYTGGEV